MGTMNLDKGQKLNLDKVAPALSVAMIGLGWEARTTDGQPFDLDVSAFMLNASGKVRSDKDFIYYGNLKSFEGAVEHTGDNQTGDGDGDDESIKVNLAMVPEDVQRVVFTVTIYKGSERRQSFGQVKDAYARLIDNVTGAEIARFDLTEDYSTETAMQMVELYRRDGTWRFGAIGQGYTGGLAAMATDFGLDVAGG